MPGVLLAAVGPVCKLPPDKLAAAIQLSHWRTGLYFGGTAWLVLTLWLLLRFRVGGRIARVADRALSRAWLQGLIAIPVWLLIFSFLQLPQALLGHGVSLRFGLSVEHWTAWWADWVKSLGLTLIIGTVVLTVLYVMMRRSPRRWWIWFWAFTMPVVVAGTLLTPVLVDPLFNHFEPLSRTDPTLVEKLEEVAHKGGLHIPPDRIFLMDASRRVTTPNAYVTGIGPSKRIVVWDTTLREESPNEILFTYGHEQGHYVLHHIPEGLVFSAAVILLFYWIGFHVLRTIVRRKGPVLGILDVGQWSSLGLILLILVVLSFLAEPIGSAFSRRIEHQADVYGQEVIHGIVPEAQATVVHSFCSDAALWLDDPAPNPLVVFWTYSHPTAQQRAEFAQHYDPWLPGRKPRYVGADR